MSNNNNNDDQYYESLVQLIDSINSNSFLSAVLQHQDDSNNLSEAKPIQKSKEDEWIEKRQGIVSAEITSSGALLLKITFKAAGFIIGDKGASIRSVCSKTGASSNSWTSNIKFDGEEQAVRVCKIVGEDNQVLFNTLRIVKAAADRYDELIQGACREKFVAKTQIVEGIRFEYKPPPLKLVTTATRTFKAPNSREQASNKSSGVTTDFFAPSIQVGPSGEQQILPKQSVPPFFTPRYPLNQTLYTPRNVQPLIVPPSPRVDHIQTNQLYTPRSDRIPTVQYQMIHQPQNSVDLNNQVAAPPFQSNNFNNTNFQTPGIQRSNSQVNPSQVSRISSAPNFPSPRQYSLNAVTTQAQVVVTQGQMTQNYIPNNYQYPVMQQGYVPGYEYSSLYSTRSGNFFPMQQAYYQAPSYPQPPSAYDLPQGFPHPQTTQGM